MRRPLVVAGILALAAFPATAADLRIAPAYKAPPVAAVAPAPGWAGTYAGLFAGYGWGRGRATAAQDQNNPTAWFYNYSGDPYSFSTDGFFGGATLGHNWQRGNIVFGLEGEIGYLGLKGSGIDPNFQEGNPPVPDTVTSVRSDFYAGAYLRAGAAIGNALLYVKGGGALLNARASTIDDCVNPGAVEGPPCGTTMLHMHGSKLMLGWAAGAGIEWMISPRTSVKAEYTYLDFGRINTGGVPDPNPLEEFFAQSIAVRAHTVKVGWNWRFGPAPVAARY